MNILNALKQLRDDIKAWVTVNLNAINAKIDEKTIPIDNKLDSNSTNPVQNQAISKEIDSINDRVGDTSVATQISQAINAQEHFSGDYNDLTNAPDISEDGSGNMIIADESGNIIFKADADGIHTTAVSINGEAAATEKYVDDAVANIDIPEVDFTGYATETYVAEEIAKIPKTDLTGYATEEYVDEAIAAIPETDFTGYATEDFVGTAIDSAKEELSESIVAESDEWKVVDEAGNIIFSVDATGAHTTELTLNGESAATESYVDDAIGNIKFPEPDLTDYATKKYVDDAVGGIEIPDADFTGYATETYVDNKVADLVNSAPEALNTLGELATALENHEDAYDALLETVGGKATHTDLENLKEELSESIVAEADEWKVVDDAGNIIFSVDADGAHTTSMTLNGQSVEDMIDDKVDKVDGKGLSTNDFTDAYKEKLDGLENMTFEESDPTVPAWAKEATKPTYTADEIGLGNVDNTSDVDKPVSTATQSAINELRTELSESIVSESEEWHIVDNNGNIVATIDASGISTTAVATQAITLNGEVIDLSNYYTKVEINAKLGDIDATLDAILKMQEELMPKKPTFTIQLAIGGTETCTFEEGMTWSDWCNSEYNTIGAYVENDMWIDLNGRYIRTADSFEVSAWESITAGETYYA